MKDKILIIIISLVVGYFIYSSFYDLHKYTKAYPSHVLHSPFGLNVLSVTFTNPKNTFYLREKKIKPIMVSIKPYEWFFALSPLFATVLISILVSIFFLFKVKLDTRQVLFLSLNAGLILYFFTFVDYLVEKHFLFLFYFMGFIISVPFLSFFRNLLGRKYRFSVTIFLVTLSVLMLILFYPGNTKEEIFLFRLMSLFQCSISIYCFFLFVSHIRTSQKNEKQFFDKTSQNETIANPENVLRKFPESSKGKSVDTRKVNIEIILAGIFLFGFSVSSIMLFTLVYIDLKTNVHYNSFFFLPALSVGLYAMLTPRLGLVFVKIVIHEALSRVMFVIFFTLLYLFLIGFNLYSMFDNDNSLFFHLTIVILSLLLLDPIRTGIIFTIDQSLFKKNIILSEYLSQISYYFNDPHNLVTLFHKLSKAVKEGLDIHEIRFYFANHLFSGLNLQADNIYYNDSIWEQVDKKKKFFSYPVFTQKSTGKVRQLLQRDQAFLLISFQKFQAAIVLSPKREKKSFYSSDIKFLRSLISYGEPLLQNYQFLLETTKIRRHQHELILAKNIQQKILPSEYENEQITLKLIVKPFQQVTGDYVDFFQRNPHEYILLLGDVSGHGLGSAYLMTILHSMMRASLKVMGEQISKGFRRVNHYLVHEYSGHDFITLVGVQIRIRENKKSNKKYAELEFINAGQHSILIYRMESQKIDILSSNQRVMGVIDTDYKAEKYIIYERFRIFVYSDGIFEIFDNKGKIIGEKEIHKWVSESGRMEIQAQKDYILSKLDRHGKTLYIMDDISLVILEVQPDNF